MTVTRNTIVRGLMLTTGLASLAAGVPASAQQLGDRTWVSTSGNDSNLCTSLSPCRTLAGAINKTNAGGEVNCLNSGEFGPFALDPNGPGSQIIITKAITIDCENGGTAAVSNSSLSGSAITVNAGPNDVVIINGLDISGARTGGYGITFKGTGALIVRNTTIRNFNYNGIAFVPTTTGSGTLTVDNVAISNSGGAGVYVSSLTRASIVRSQLSNNGIGVSADSGNTPSSIFVSMRSSTVTNSTQYGVYANNLSGRASYVTIAIDDSTISGSASVGLFANGNPAGMLVNNSTIVNNYGGGLVASNGGVIYSYGNNRVNGNNQKDGTFTSTISQR